MIQVLKAEYFSKADAFLLPLTGLAKDEKYPVKSYLFWNEYTIEDYNLILEFEYNNYADFIEYCRTRLFPLLDKRGYLVESYDLGNRSIFVLDIGEWAMDIEMFLAGHYSKMSKTMKDTIEKYHTFNGYQIPIYIYAVLYPNIKMALLREDGKDKTPIEYVAKNYGFDIEDMKEIGEIGSVYEPILETLLTDIENICQTVSKES